MLKQKSSKRLPSPTKSQSTSRTKPHRLILRNISHIRKHLSPKSSKATLSKFSSPSNTSSTSSPHSRQSSITNVTSLLHPQSIQSTFHQSINHSPTQQMDINHSLPIHSQSILLSLQSPQPFSRSININNTHQQQLSNNIQQYHLSSSIQLPTAPTTKNYSYQSHSLQQRQQQQQRSQYHNHIQSQSFHSTQPTQFIGRVLIAAGLAATFLGARYIARGASAFYQAYTNTEANLKPLGDEDRLHAHNEVVAAAEEVVAAAEVEENEIKLKQQKEAEKQQRREDELRKQKNGSAPKFIQDDFSDHIDLKALERKKQQEEAEQLNKLRYESNEEELYMNEVIEQWEHVLRGDGGLFNETMNTLEAENILQISSTACLEAMKERRGILMRLNHPDHGGSSFLTQKINDAFQLLSANAKSDPEWVKARELQKKQEFEERKRIAEEALKQQLIKEGVLDANGEVKHPDGPNPTTKM